MSDALPLSLEVAPLLLPAEKMATQRQPHRNRLVGLQGMPLFSPRLYVESAPLISRHVILGASESKRATARERQREREMTGGASSISCLHVIPATQGRAPSQNARPNISPKQPAFPSHSVPSPLCGVLEQLKLGQNVGGEFLAPRPRRRGLGSVLQDLVSKPADFSRGDLLRYSLVVHHVRRAGGAVPTTTTAGH